MSQEKRNAYSILSINKGATEDQIKQAYVNLVKKYDPEKHTERFMIIQDAFNRLKDPARRCKEDIISLNLLAMDFNFTEQEKADVDEAQLEGAISMLSEKRQADPAAAPALLPKLIQALYMRSFQRLKKRLHAEAREDWEMILQLDPTQQRAKNNLLCYHCRMGYQLANHTLYEDAIKEWERAVQMNPDNHLLIHNLALAYEFSERYDEASRYWMETLRRWKAQYERQPEDEYLKLCLMEGYRHHSEMGKQDNVQRAPSQTADKAPVAVRPSAQPSPSPSPAPVPPQTMSNPLQRPGQPAPRPPQAAPGQPQPPRPPAAGDRDELQAQIEILKLNPEDFEANFKVAHILLERKQWPQAVKQLDEMSRKFPKNIEVLNAMGWALINTGEVDRAFQTWNRGRKMDPKNFAIREALIKAHLMMGRALRDKNLLVNALVHFKALSRELPDSDEVHYEMGRTYQLKGDKRSAQLEFQKCLKANPKHKGARQALSDLNLR